jgi:hypothetical protein
LPSDAEAVNDLGNAIDIYTEKWTAILKGEKDRLLESSKAVDTHSHFVE